MAEDNKAFTTNDPAGGAKPMNAGTTLKLGQSTIFNTSVRGWIALIMGAGLTAAVLMIIVGELMGKPVTAAVGTLLLTCFVSSISQAITHYFQTKTTEGQKI